MSKPFIIDPMKIPDLNLMGRTFFFQGTYTRIHVDIVDIMPLFVGIERHSENGFRYKREYVYLVKHNNTYLLWDCHDYWYPVEETSPGMNIFEMTR